jgi:hypothetical protein
MALLPVAKRPCRGQSDRDVPARLPVISESMEVDPPPKQPTWMDDRDDIEEGELDWRPITLGELQMKPTVLTMKASSMFAESIGILHRDRRFQ